MNNFMTKKEMKATGGSSSNPSALTLTMKRLLFGDENAEIDPRQKTMAIAIPILMVILVGVLIFVLHEPKKATAKTKADHSAKNHTIAAKKELTWEAPEQWPDVIRDPLRFGSSMGEEKDKVHISGIVFSKRNPSVIIDGRLVKEGESIYGIEVLKIHRESVDFKKDDFTWTQTIK